VTPSLIVLKFPLSGFPVSELLGFPLLTKRSHAAAAMNPVTIAKIIKVGIGASLK
jgi:hypothetical protein